MAANGQLISPAGHKNVPLEVFQLLSEVVEDKNALGLHTKWYRFYELGKNKHWRKQAKEATLVSANLLSVHRRRTINSLTDNNPTFNVRRVVKSADPEDRFKSVLRATEHWWNETEQQLILELSIHNGETNGVTIEKSVFDLDKEYGIGEVDALVVDPYHFGIYPVDCLDIQKAEAVFHYYPENIGKVKRKYGELAKDVKPDFEIASDVGESRRFVTGINENTPQEGVGSTFIGGVIKKLSALLNTSGTSRSDKCLICECWVKDYSIDEETKNPVYPGFIRVITVVNGTIVLSDRPNPSINPNLPIELSSNTYLFDKFPFCKANSNNDPINFWGESDFEQLIGLQKEFNKSLSQLTSIKDKASGVKFINPVGSGVHNEEIRSGVSVLNPTNANHGLGWVAPPPIPRELIESIEMYKELFFAVAGTFDLEQANTPGSQVIAYKAIAALIERTSTMMRGKIRNYSKLIRDRGRMAVSQMQNWYTEERFVSFEDSNGDEGQITVLGKDMIIPLNLSVVSGSTMPVSEVQRREEALTLYDKGAIDAEELLKYISWDKYKEVITRMHKGVIGQFLDTMVKIGMPEEMVNYFNEIASIEESKLERAIDRHEIPTFNEMFIFQGIEPDSAEKIKLAKAQSEIKESDARVAKLAAEKLAIEVTARKEEESIRQTDERIKIDRAKINIDAQKVGFEGGKDAGT